VATAPCASGMETLDCPKDLVGRVIGRKGETINELQARSGVRIQIDQTVPDGQPCKIVISGDPEAVRRAVPLVHEVMSHGPPSRSKHPGAPPGPGGPGMPPHMGPPPGYGGYPPPQGYGGYPQQPVYAPPPYYAPPPQMGYPPAGYAPPPYGYAPPPGYQQPPQQQTPPQQAPAPAAGQRLWQEHTAQDGNVYWYNTQTGQSQWEKPADA